MSCAQRGFAAGGRFAAGDRALRGVIVAWGLCWLLPISPVLGQADSRENKDSAALIVEGVVQKVFTSSSTTRAENLVQIEVQQSTTRRAAPGRARVPAPGEIVYAHVSSASSAGPFGNSRGASSRDGGVVPEERAQVRAYLVAREDGTWAGAGSEWFEPLAGNRTAARPTAGTPTASGPAVVSLGMTYEPQMVKDRLVLRVKSVERSGPAQQAGIEVGDVIIGVQENPLQSAAQLEALARNGAVLSLMVVDVNTNQTARVELRPESSASAPVAVDAAAPAASGPAVVSLGMTYEPQMVKDRLVLRVKSVERNGPAQQAGIEVGDVIIGVQENPLQSAGQLEALARNGAALSLMVVDVNTNKPARVELRPESSGSAPVAADAAPAASRRSLGLSAEPVRLGQRTALKVVRVQDGSPAQKAGIEPEDILVAANGAPLTSPEQLGSALRKSGSTLTLTVRDSRTGNDVPVDVAVGGPADRTPLPTDVPSLGTSSGGLGAVTELSFYDVEVALKVTEVTPGSPAARAGLQPGYLIIAANGQPVLHPNELNDVVRKSNGALRLTVVDPRSNRQNTMEVNLGR